MQVVKIFNGGVKRYEKEEFEKMAKAKHGNRYLYDLTDAHAWEFIEDDVYTRVVCPDHGGFDVLPKDHLEGWGCPKCVNTSRGERRTAAWLSYLGYIFYREYTPPKMIQDPEVGRFRFDFWLPKLEIAVEYHGRQHYHPPGWSDGQTVYIETTRRDRLKKAWCKDNEVPLLVIPYTVRRKDFGNCIQSKINRFTGADVFSIFASPWMFDDDDDENEDVWE
jgi:hypothetical protein